MTYSGWYYDSYGTIREYGPSEFLQELFTRLQGNSEPVDDLVDLF